MLANRSLSRSSSFSPKEEALDTTTENPPSTQLVLDLKREKKELPVPRDATVLLQTLADLLLGALGEPVEEPASAAHDKGGADAPEDHA
jgi:hypothetical protein